MKISTFSAQNTNIIKLKHKFSSTSSFFFGCKAKKKTRRHFLSKIRRKVLVICSRKESERECLSSFSSGFKKHLKMCKPYQIFATLFCAVVICSNLVYGKYFTCLPAYFAPASLHFVLFQENFAFFSLSHVQQSRSRCFYFIYFFSLYFSSFQFLPVSCSFLSARE